MKERSKTGTVLRLWRCPSRLATKALLGRVNVLLRVPWELCIVCQYWSRGVLRSRCICHIGSGGHWSHGHGHGHHRLAIRVGTLREVALDTGRSWGRLMRSFCVVLVLVLYYVWCMNTYTWEERIGCIVLGFICETTEALGSELMRKGLWMEMSREVHTCKTTWDPQAVEAALEAWFRRSLASPLSHKPWRGWSSTWALQVLQALWARVCGMSCS